MIMALITLDPDHVDDKTTGPSQFLWQQQMRFYWAQADRNSKMMICDYNHELYGYMTLWIESMNTVMDDSKVLTLVSNERIPLSIAMRMIFETNSLKNASPATASRAGILYINEGDVGWHPYVDTWITSFDDAAEASFISSLIDKFVDIISEFMRKGFKQCTPIRVLSQVKTLTQLLDALLPPLTGKERTNENIENVIAFAAIWSFGGSLVVDKGHGIDSRKDFHEQFVAAFPQAAFPREGLCFDYFFDPKTADWQHWNMKLHT
jgi:dynein heavy chain